LKGRKVEVITQKEFIKLALGDTIGYRMKAADHPTNPLRIWKGEVISIDQLGSMLTVAVLDKGYEGEKETIGREQIILIEHQARQKVAPSV